VPGESRKMKLEKNIVRINGWKGNKRSHVDVEWQTTPNNTNWGKGDTVVIGLFEDRICKVGFESGLDGVTSYNAYNFVGDCRITTRIW
jgi:hypothetical protein